MPENSIPSLISSVAVAIIILLIEYFIIQPFKSMPISSRKQFIFSAATVFILFLPIIALREISVRFVEMFFQSYAVPTRVEVYASTYAMLVLPWGIVWAVRIRPWILKHLSRE